MQIAFLVFMFIIGAAFGSFLCCQARRLHLRDGHRRVMRAKGDPQNACEARFWGKSAQQDPSGKRHSLPKRSICLHCHKQLKWYDNLPIISWLALRGKCRFCHKKIGTTEILSELGSALALLAIGTTININTATPVEWATFAFTILATFTLIFLAIYDGAYGELPTFALIIAAILSIAAVLPGLITSFSWQPFLAAGLYGGIYLLLYIVSKGKWVGDGDWILAATTGLILGTPWLAMVALFLANFIACIVTIPTLKNKKDHQIFFGPFLVMAFVIVYTFSDFLTSVI